MEPICEHAQHLCPGCLAGGECVDLFTDPTCGLVACTSDLPPRLSVVPARADG